MSNPNQQQSPPVLVPIPPAATHSPPLARLNAPSPQHTRDALTILRQDGMRDTHSLENGHGLNLSQAALGPVAVSAFPGPPSPLIPGRPGGGVILVKPVVPFPIPDLNAPLNSSVPGSNSSEQVPVPESQLSEFPPVDVPDFTQEDDILPSVNGVFGTADEEPPNLSGSSQYKINVRTALTTGYVRGSDTVGYRDGCRYVVEINENVGPDENGTDTLGEATYFTAVAVVALAADNYAPDTWEAANANSEIEKLLDVLSQNSWGNRDSDGVEHPIRHPAWLEYHISGLQRQRPLSRDSFGQILAACYYAYNCPNSTLAVRAKAQSLLDRWVKYLSSHDWLLHHNSWPGELEVADKKYRNIFSNKEHTGGVTYLGPETFTLFPTDLYALKNCAASLSVSHNIIPFLNFVSAIPAQFPVEEIAADIGVQARIAFKFVLDPFKFRKKFVIELVPGWDKSKIKGTFSSGLPEHVQNAILDAFERTVREMIVLKFREPLKAAEGLQAIIPAGIDSIIDLFPDVLRSLPLASVLEDLIKQVMPWLDYELLLEYFAFAAASKLGMASNINASDSGYLFWTYLVEMETQPVLTPLLKSVARDFYHYMSHRNNPNGLWAWLCGKSAVVTEQLTVFESNTARHDWISYAYSKEYEQWITDDRSDNPAKPDQQNRGSSRADYLALQGLAEKGAPKANSIVLNLKMLLDAIEDAVKALIAATIRTFTELGRYEVLFIDAVGATVQEIVDKSVGFVRNIWRDGQQTSSTLHRLTGEVVEQWRWIAGQGFTGYSRWAKGAVDRIPFTEDLLELQIRATDGILRVWKWGTDRAINEFFKYSTSAADGLIDATHMVVQMFRNAADGWLHQWIILRGALQSYLGWSTSTRAGLVDAANCAMHTLRDPAGQVRRWEYEANRTLKTFLHYATSAVDGNSMSDILQHAFRTPTGDLYVNLFTNDIFHTGLHWSVSSQDGIATAANCILYQFRAADGVLQQWHLEAGVPKKYYKWATSTKDGAAAAEQMVESVERIVGGKYISRTFKDGKAVVEKTLDGVGHVLSQVTKPVGDVGKKVEDWWHHHGLHL